MDIQRETENLRRMWNRHSHTFLKKYIGKQSTSPQPLLTSEVLLNIVARSNSALDIDREARAVHRVAPRLLGKGGSWRRRAYLMLLRIAHTVRKVRLAGRAEIVRPSLLDVGCGSGNYYRVFTQTGLNGFIEYTGLDISEKNVANSVSLYPKSRYRAVFNVGNILELPVNDKTFDVVMVNSVLEHLSIDMLPTALRECLRVARKVLIINFFNERNIPEHEVHPLKSYHWNCLSRTRLVDILSPHAVDIAITESYPFVGKVSYIARNGMPIRRTTYVVTLQ